MLSDRKRAQRGSVLSAVLIIVAFLSIVAGALMTELSTNFLISRALIHRVANQAAVNSAMELTLDKLQNTNLNSSAPCPNWNPVAPDGRSVAVTYVSCWPTVDSRSPQFVPFGSSKPFNVDGMHALIRAGGPDLYLVGDSGGNVYQFTYGQSTPDWSMPLKATISGPPLVMPDVSSSPADVTNLVPLSNAASTGCGANTCVELLGQDVGKTPDVSCFMAASGPVTARPAAGIADPTVAFFGDSHGDLYAYTATEKGNCALQDSITVPGSQEVVAGPLVIRNGGNDEVYIVTSEGGSSQLVHYSYDGDFALVDNVKLSAANGVGMGLEPNVLPALPVRVAITFDNGAMAMIRIDGAYHASLAVPVTPLGASIGDAPYWSGNLIGVGVDRTFNLLNTNLVVVASHNVGWSIRTTPGVDAAGDWFFGADSGSLYEMQFQAGPPSTFTLVATLGSAGASIRSAPVVSGCPTGICIYLGATNSNLYLVPLDARDAVFTACVSTSPQTCSSDNPRVWAQVEVGVANRPQTVHVQGWSYYSP